jgi:uncharacterized coiled-coil protein SlyX
MSYPDEWNHIAEHGIECLSKTKEQAEEANDWTQVAQVQEKLDELIERYKRNPVIREVPEEVPPPIIQVRAALDLLSGDLNYDNVAKAKKILKEILN